MMMATSKSKTTLDARGLEVHGAEPVSHRFTIADADGNADVELNFSFPLTRKRHVMLEHLLEEGYSEHEAYVLIAGGEIMAHMQSIKQKNAKPDRLVSARQDAMAPADGPRRTTYQRGALP